MYLLDNNQNNCETHRKKKRLQTVANSEIHFGISVP